MNFIPMVVASTKGYHVHLKKHSSDADEVEKLLSILKKMGYKSAHINGA